jgi:tRNA (guanine37-N1)-methyltransferase
MRVQVVTIFPELIDAFGSVGLISKACAANILRIETMSPRAFTHDKHQTVDDAPYGGGSGMVMLPEPLMSAVEALDQKCAEAGEARAHRIILTPSGAPFTQAHAQRLAQRPALMLICGRYEGIDDRVRELCDEELSLGDFVLNGGEVAAIAVIEAVSRLLPGMLGNAESLAQESHTGGLLEYPQFTRPRTFRGREVPEILLSGNHAAIARWRRKQSLLKTRAARPDLFAQLELGKDDRKLLDEADREGEES